MSFLSPVDAERDYHDALRLYSDWVNYLTRNMIRVDAAGALVRLQDTLEVVTYPLAVIMPGEYERANFPGGDNNMVRVGEYLCSIDYTSDPDEPLFTWYAPFSMKDQGFIALDWHNYSINTAPIGSRLLYETLYPRPSGKFVIPPESV
jgi:hypothetical protein